ncbi:hypothetical protein O181_008384 [Austropuccinia psidii MF-1]|uniref:Uncharacterized protein n=1 Tax=Austropuccinia psidii MF-1 TaxID=1389203 RepID=A0A9Q3GIT7_9BASI|nr:hypothetical protein [Austropuccinia psidii MF-1]
MGDSIRENSLQEPEIVSNTSNRIRHPATKNITPTQMEHSVVTPKSNIQSNALWLQMSKFEELTQERFATIQGNNVTLGELKASQNKIFKALQESYAKLSKASEEANKRLNQVLEEQHHCKRDRECLNLDIKKLLNVFQNIRLQPQGNVLDNSYHQGDIKPDSLL